MSVDNPQPIKLGPFTLRVTLRYQAPLRCIFIRVFWHFQFLFPVFLCLFVIGCICPRGTLSVSRLSFAQIKGPKLSPEIKVIASAVIFRPILTVSKISGFWSTAIEVYCYKLFAMNVTLEIANIYDLMFEEFYDLSDASGVFFLKRRELFLRTAYMEVFKSICPCKRLL